MDNAPSEPEGSSSAKEGSSDVAMRSTALVDVSHLNLKALITSGSHILGKSLARLSERTDDNAIAGFSQGLA